MWRPGGALSHGDHGKDEINVPIALSAFRDKIRPWELRLIPFFISIVVQQLGPPPDEPGQV